MADRSRSYGDDDSRRGNRGGRNSERGREPNWGGMERGYSQGRERNSSEEDRYMTGHDFETNQPRYSNYGEFESEGSSRGGREYGGRFSRETSGSRSREFASGSGSGRGWQRGNEPGRWNESNESDFRTRNYGTGSSFGRDAESYSRYGGGDFGDYQRNQAQGFGRHESGGRYGQMRDFGNDDFSRGTEFGGSWGSNASNYGSGQERDFNREDWNRNKDDRFDSGQTSARDFTGYQSGGYGSNRTYAGSGSGFGAGSSNRDWERSGSYAGNSYSSGRSYGGGSGSYGSGSNYDSGYSGYGSGSFDRDRNRDWERDRGDNESIGDKIGRFFGLGPKGYKRSDDRVKEDVSEALHDDPNVDASNIEVQVKDGEVTLTGTVNDRYTKRMAEDCAHAVRGVNDVHNQLRVQSQSRFGSQSSFNQSTSNTTTTSGTSPVTSEGSISGTESGKKPNKAA